MDPASNNKFPGNPGIMCDGRLFTDYRPSVDVNEQLDTKYLGHHHNDYLYRQYLTHNGKNLIDQEYQTVAHNVKCKNINSQKYTETGLPGVSSCDDTSAYIDFVARPKNLM